MRSDSATLWPDVSALEGVSEHQSAAAQRMLRGRVCCLTGGPGTGKTHTAAAILRRIVERRRPSDVAVCAPTGKAAVRITAAMARHDLPLAATTIHRLLEVGRNGHDGKGWGFRRGPGNPISQRFVAIDEVSMLDTDLAASLFAALPPAAHVLLIGDTGQLPPVGHGAPLRDLLAGGIPHGELTEIRRNAGDIVVCCDRIRRGLPFQASPRLDMVNGHNLLHLSARSGAIGLRECETFLDRLRGSSVDPVWGCQVLTITNDSGDVGRVAVNRRLRDLLNPNQIPQGARFALSEKVICLSNQFVPALPGYEQEEGDGDLNNAEQINAWLAERKPEQGDNEFVANGETGRVVSTGKGFAWVYFDLPARLCRFAGEQLDSLDLAYAITVHKSQGSQWPVVVYLVDDSRGARWVGCRELVYTAISRAERLAVCIGRQDVIDTDCRKLALANRKTFLREQVEQFYGEQHAEATSL